MAEGIMKHLLQREELIDKVEVCSAGISTVDGMRASENAVEVMKSKGIDITGHRSKLLTKEMIKEVDLILVMTENHKRVICSLSPEYSGKIFKIKEYAGVLENSDITDPFGMPKRTYEYTANELYELIEKIVEKLRSRI
jgi:protein-tyrosine phosphatase